MALTTNQPIERDGKIYDQLAANLALSLSPRIDGCGAAVAVRLTPYLIGEEGPEQLEDDAKAVVYGDAIAEAANDADVAAFLLAMKQAAQAFINAKGL